MQRSLEGVSYLGKYIAKILFGQDNRKFKNKYLKKLEKLDKNRRKRSWTKFLQRRNFKGEVMSEL